MKKSERRRAKRTGVVGLTAKCVSNMVEHTVELLTISAVGGVLVCDPLIVVGAELPLRFSFSKGELRVDARVIRTEPIPESRFIRVAVEFHPSLELKRAVRELQRRLEQQ